MGIIMGINTTVGKTVLSSLTVFFTVFCGVFLCQKQVLSKSITIRSHPNHYILLIDASRSTANTRVRSNRYKTILKEILLERLYLNGFGSSIPSYDPDSDYLTLLHFGVVPEHCGNVELCFKESDLLKNYIHNSFAWKKDVSKEDILSVIWPENFYKITLLLWSRQLALISLLTEQTSNISNRTFLIRVHDGILNGQTLHEEIRWAKRNGEDRRIKKFEQEKTELEEKYMFSDGNGTPEKFWEEEFEQNGESYFLEAWEVISRSRHLWEKELSLSPTLEKNISFVWTRETLKNPGGVLQLYFAKKFIELIKIKESSLSVEFQLGKVVKKYRGEIKPFIKYSFIIPGELPKNPKEYSVIVDVGISHKVDNLLGVRSLDYSFNKRLLTPIPGRFTKEYLAERRRNIAIMVILGIIAIALSAWFFYFRVISTHIKLVFPGLTFPLPVSRGKEINGGTPVHPAEGVSPFSIRLPGMFKQRVLYSGARILLGSGEGGEVYWKNGNKKEMNEIKLPVKNKNIKVWWKSMPDSAQLSVVFEQKNKTYINLTFPSGIVGGKENG